MRLICEFDNGTTADIQTAIALSPYDVRGLINEAFFHCLRVLPDSYGFLQAEGSVRHVLETFQADQDRYIENYITARSFSLGDQSQLTPRAELVHASLRAGGPLALIGVFHATFNASRNAQNLETLNFFLNESTEASKQNLYKRAAMFPCNPSICTWFSRLIGRLSPSSRALAYLLSCLGTSEVSRRLFSRALKPSETWGTDGEITAVDPQPHKFLDHVSSTTAMRELETIGFLRITPTLVRADQRLVQFLQQTCDLSCWRIQAVEMVCHAFPKHRSIDPECYEAQCELILPCLRHVLSYFADPKIVLHFSNMPILSVVVEACLSASDFGDQVQKDLALSTAEKLLEASKKKYFNEHDHVILQARVSLKKAMAIRSYTHIPFLGARCISSNQRDPRSNALSAEIAIFKAEKEMSSNRFDLALRKLDAFITTTGSNLSTLEKIKTMEVATVYGNMLRCIGHFSEAYQLLEPLPRTHYVTLYLSSVLCELGDCDRAITMLEGQLQLRTNSPCLQEETRIALAHVYCFKSMQAVKNGQQDKKSLKVATEMYLDLRQLIRAHTQKANLDRFSISAGIAVISCIKGELENSWIAWNEAFLALKSSGLSFGYTDALVLYIMSEIEFERHTTKDSQLHRDKARAVFMEYNRQHRFLGLGSLCPDIIGILFMT
ncbi:hypothetical protein F4810DRAFT_94991 [Camillea tinctor]|nr:hypothetical protein F4810DRAFT_94991 [Camillea tinctor]